MNLNSQIASMFELLEILSDPVKYAEYEKQFQAARAARRAKHDRKIAVLMSRLTDKQDAIIEQYKRDGASVNKFFTDRVSGNVAVMLARRDIWNQAKQRLCTKIIMVYPNGERVETLERSISIKTSF